MFRRTYSFLFAGKRKLFAAPLLLLVFAGSAFAAWAIFSGASGSGSGSFSNATTQTAITITGTTPPALSPGATVAMPVTIANNDPNVAHVLSTLTGTFTTTPSQCATYLSITASSVTGISVLASSSQTANLPIILAATAPVSCASGTYSVALAGTTTP